MSPSPALTNLYSLVDLGEIESNIDCAFSDARGMSLALGCSSQTAISREVKKLKMCNIKDAKIIWFSVIFIISRSISVSYNNVGGIFKVV